MRPYENNTRSSAVAETVRLLRGSVLAKYNWKRIFCTEPYRSVFNYCDVMGLLIAMHGVGQQEWG